MSRPSTVDYTLYLVTDRSLSRGRSTLEVVRSAVSGGVTCVQLREKEASTRTFIEEARAIKVLLDDKGIPLIINDRVDVALAVGAAGVHLGQSDMHIRDARRLLPPEALIGISAESLEDALAAERGGADYIGVSPVFATPTKTDTALPLGLDGVRKIRSAVGIPVVGIGGIGLANAAEVMMAGADGIAVVSAIVAADDPQKAAKALKKKIG
ncbi:thiamine phosphate synthase [Desulfoluna butyratoxydans]|uniref:Thiamine-phosphate synthase n=1 Tax=Desulfoluna butyratoxydans TaxID=231438 RepID=A0A4U8YNV4_9BACT|nr:thiamine phosphate synthase [Desulfoluna butyratoxydans]VFQ44939.1 thiamine phosphate synthase/teni [Desulfoluna butyratoxydans]